MRFPAMGRIGIGAVLFASLGIVQLPAAAQEIGREHGHWPPPSIIAPANGATVTGPVTVTVGFPDGGQAQGNGEHHHHEPHLILVVDAPLPVAGSTVQADAQHVTVPEGQTQVSLSLPPGQHQLRLTALGREGTVSGRFPDEGAISFTVQ